MPSPTTGTENAILRPEHLLIEVITVCNIPVMIAGPGRAKTSEDGFSNELSRLKRHGASILVVGSVRPDHRRDTCRRLLGRGAEKARRRVLISTTSETNQLAKLADDADSETLSMISYDAQARTTAASRSTSDSSISSSPTEVDALADLGLAISRAIDSFEHDADGLEPAELRVGVDSVLPLLEEYGRKRIFKFLHLTNGRTRDVSGMVHYHLPVERTAKIVPVLSPLFDVVVELREQHGEHQERWMIDDGTHSSGWLSITTK